MDKPLSDKKIEADNRQQDKQSPASPAEVKAVSVSPSASPNDPISNDPAPNQAPNLAPNLGNGPIGAYSAASTRPLLTQKAYEELNPKKTWMEDPKHRLAIRMFSRGILGAAFFVAGGMAAKKWMVGYDASKSFSAQSNKNPLTFIAKLVDTGVGKPIEAAVGAIAGKEAGIAAVHFRPTRYGREFGREMHGRSLGNEVVNITFDFFCASVGDAWGRDIAGWFDPNVKKSWTDEKGHIKIPEAIKSALKSVTRYVTYNGGEDWAVSIPYAYFMKGQRALINRGSPGFKYDFDRNANGGSFKVNDHKIVGNYQMEGILDLQNRFTVYNVGTLMYREAYDYIGNKIAGKPDNLYGAPDREPHKNVLGKAGDLLKWVARSAVKGVIIMTPAVPFFWITRSPQTKHRGTFVDPEKGVLGRADTHEAVYANTKLPDGSVPLEYLQYKSEPRPGKTGYYDHVLQHPAGTAGEFVGGRLAQPHSGRFPNRNRFDAYGKAFGIADVPLNAVGKANYQAANLLDKPAAWADKNMGSFGADIKDHIGVPGGKLENFTRPMIYAAASYTPYMYAKAEFANLWDNGKMDMSAERMIDGAAKLNWGEFKAGAGEVWNSILHKPLKDPVREAEGQRRNMIETSPPDIFTKCQAQTDAEKCHAEEGVKARQDAEAKQAAETKPVAEPKSAMSWQERIISGPAVEKKSATAISEKAKPQKTHADQEAMRKALEELNPPTNSIN